MGRTIIGPNRASEALANTLVIDGRHAIDRREGLVYEGLTW